MPGSNEYRLEIDAFSVDTLPMSRLAEYMAELARLLGEEERVHFKKLEPGSAVLITTVEAPAAPKVEERIAGVADGRAPTDALKAFRTIDTMLAKDNAIATLSGGEGSNVIAFPGRTRPKPVRYGPFRERGSLDGVLIRLGGRDSTIPVLIKDAEGAEHNCQTTLEVSKRLANHYRGGTLRVYGNGKWLREENGSWVLQQFDIDDFEVLDDAPLLSAVEKLRSVPGGDWDEVDILGLRKDAGETH
ncbi:MULTISPECIES: hypothetical protein [Methylosinus]|uniref:Uncharacterized protein n=1 Tax=Methylosinus trichosporium (strain ATCC 35070 / NCIMB 11131 / UNIQEM 75 / OB3b) TaxID=595536 RepID=A0A2D2D2K7_METT3|nr:MULTISPECIES: hypothetical protein [Methylosinus]ATQ69220.1 hypothetical protein CQW49_16030 [Methylosinus trichosporium OB3b]OBS53294.1 hypothetical protein A8B73_06860 [Methylosinus sp. 3S-1]